MHTYAFIPYCGIATTVIAATLIEACSAYRNLGYTLDSPGLLILRDDDVEVCEPDESDLPDLSEFGL